MSAFAAQAAAFLAGNSLVISVPAAIFRRVMPGWDAWAAAFAVTSAVEAFLRWSPAAAADTATALFCTWMWYRRRRRGRKRAGGLAGAKSRARVARIAGRMRETLRPRPSLRPVPQGAS